MTSKPKVNLTKVASNADVLEALLEVLNKQLDGYVPKEDVEREFRKRIDPRNKVDSTSLQNSLQNVLISAEGLPILSPTNEQGLPDDSMHHTSEYLDHSAQILQTKLIERMQLLSQDSSGKTVERDWYKITLRGLEELNAIKLNRNIKQFKASNESSDFIIAVLTFALVAIGIIQIMGIIKPKVVAMSGYTISTLFALLTIFSIIGLWIFFKYVIFGVIVRRLQGRDEG